MINPRTVSASAPSSDSSVEIPFEKYTLDNGLEVILHSDRSVPLVAVDVWYHVGSGDERPGLSGFAHLFEHMMFQGAKHIGSDVHFDTLRKVGGTSVNGTTNKDRTNYFEVVPSHQIETALWLESDRMGYLLDLLNQEALDNQIDVVRNERRQRYDNVPFGKERFAIAAGLYPEGHPYRYLTIGKHEDLETAKLEDVRAFFRQWYVPSNATLVLAGDFDLDEGKALVDKWFGSFPRFDKPGHTAPPKPTPTQQPRVELDDPFAKFTRLHFAWHSPARLAEGDAELSVLGRVLGASGWGRLYKRLVLDAQSAQRVSAYQSGSGFSGEFHVIVDVKPGFELSKVEAVVAEELAKATTEPISDVELRRVVNGFESGVVWGLEEVIGRAERLQFFNHYAGDPGHTEAYLQRFRDLTPQDVLNVSKATLDAPRVEVVSRPAKPAGGAE
jgi:predicted Zn-dependent peptidase